MRVAIVNDLPLAREALRRLIQSIPGCSVAWQAEDGSAAVDWAARDRPDAILMDLCMPGTDGVEATRQIMQRTPCPILIVTASVASNYPLVVQAMNYGALDAVNTPVFSLDGQLRQGEQLVERLERLRNSVKSVDWRSGSLPPCGKESVNRPQPLPGYPPVLAVGASTGGPEAVGTILETLPEDFPAAVLVVQHISADFTPNLATWLQSRCRLPVALAQPGDRPRAARVLLAGRNDHLRLEANLELTYCAAPVEYPYRPSVNVTFESLARYWPQPGVGVLLTGMGTDGAEGLAALRSAGWLTLAQDAGSCVVYGMPRAAVELHAACRVLPLREMPAVILARLRG